MSLKCLAATLLSLCALAAQATDKIVFATNWKAQAAHGGFYQALVDGTYSAHGLEVSIRQGGPQVNNRPLLPAGKIDFLMTGNLLHSFDNVKNGVPVIAVAAIFQKDPQALIAHPGQGYTWERWQPVDGAPGPVTSLKADAQGVVTLTLEPGTVDEVWVLRLTDAGLK